MAVKTKLQRAERRQVIVDAASTLFAERGFRGVTTRELARSAGVSEPVLYEHFRTKEDLYSAIIDHAKQQKAGEQDPHALLDSWASIEDPRVYFTKLANVIADFHTTHPEYIRQVLFAALEGHELADLCFERNSGPVFAKVAAYLKSRMAAGQLRSIEPTIAARAIVGAIMQYCLFELHFGFRTVRASKKRTLEGIVDLFLNGILK
jgi:AcrR family transcriptional regulator